MLVLTRGINETIMIGEGIEIMVVEVKGRKVKLGVRAPTEVPVHRKEVFMGIQQENINAARNNAFNADNIAAIKKLLAAKQSRVNSQ